MEGKLQKMKKINKNYWEIADDTKKRLFNVIRNSFKNYSILDVSLDVSQAEEYRKQRLEEVQDLIFKEWKKIKKEYENNPSFDKERLSGYVYEALFYLCSLDLTAFYFEMDLYWMSLSREGKRKIETELGAPPHFEFLPLYDIISPILYKAVDSDKVKTPTLGGDFIGFYVEGPSGRRATTPIVILDVKKSESTYKKGKGKWLAIAALRHGLIAQIAYPKKILDKICSLKDWEIKTICPDCGKLMDKIYPVCPFCEKDAYPYTRGDWKEF